MDFLQTLDPANTLFLAVGCAVLCGVGLVLLLGLQILGSALNIFTALAGLFSDPLGGCGCVLGLLGCAGCAALSAIMAQSLATCGTPNAVNFCRLFGL